MGSINRIDLHQVDLNLLVVFQALMQEGSVTRAGYKLSLSQSAVSAALGRLRKLFDDPLFERSRSGMTPTPKALSLSLSIGPSLSTIAAVILDDVEFEPWQSARTFHLAMSDDIEMLFGPWVARQKLDHNWSVNFAIHQTNSHLWRETLDDPLIDVVLTTTPAHMAADFRAEPMFSGDYRCVHNPRLLNLSNPLTTREYIETRHLRVSYDLQRGWVDEVLAAMGHQRNTLCTISHFSGIGPILLDLPVIATIPEHVAVRVGEMFDLRVSPVPLQMPRFTISALWRTEVDGLIENQWIRQLCNTFVQVQGL
ncbi:MULTISPECIES: LysR family transcriptional regulator [unclassified Microbacterium]|uniref:LysR family transcriptional regulator n=1 Tax=unclassified Microbacterium TaxID=2609290 RepID=UPI0016052E0A|nr:MULTISPECIES: LysR family transcriptional regulator [unclassified Microbacterium]QNA91841.1 LysR family transcriptional regulator [Microbacterium sp. Se63.02b]QYM65056.1 LysR family transcriptional regulator [Microbacterium sp. Se5.02b]